MDLQRRPFIIDQSLLVKVTENSIQSIHDLACAAKLEPRIMSVLVKLAESPFEVVLRKDLISINTDESTFSDEALTLTISRLRKCLSENFGKSNLIKTTPKIGYSLMADVRLFEVSSPVHKPRIYNYRLMAAICLVACVSVSFAWLYRQTSANVDMRNVSNVETSYPSWSPDGKWLAVQSNRADNDSEIYLMSDAGTSMTRLTFNPGLDEYPCFSKSGQKILFTSSKDGNQEIYSMNRDGSGQKNISFNKARDFLPRWSPDENSVLFTSDRTGNLDLYIIELRSGQVQRLTDSPADEKYGVWSPSGDSILFVRMSENKNADIYLMDRVQKTETKLTKESSYDSWPAWSADGSKVYFSSNRSDGRTYQLYVMNADGTNPIKLTNGESENASYTKPVVGRDGRVACTRTKDGSVEVFVIFST